MSRFNLQHFDRNMPIVDPETGLPTPYFLEMLFGNTDNAQQNEETLATAVQQSRLVDTGFGLSGGGNLTADRTLALGNPALADPGADRGLFWDDSAGQLDWLTFGSGLSLTDKTLTATGGGSSLNPPASGDFSITLNSPTITDHSAGIVMAGSANTSLLRGILNSLPGGDFSVRIKVQGSWGIDFNGAGILFRDTAGKYVFASVLNVSGSWFEAQGWGDHTTFSVGGAAAWDLNTANWPEWIRCDFNSSTNDIDCFVSWDGEIWVPTGTSTYLGTADAVGIGIGNRHASVGILAVFTHYEVV